MPRSRRPRSSALDRGGRPVATALAIVVLGLVLFVVAAWHYHAVLIGDARDRTARLSFLLSEQAARTFEAVDFTLRGFEPLLDQDGPSRQVQLRDLLRRRATDLSFVQAIRVLDSDGTVRVSSDLAAVGTVETGCLSALAAPGVAPMAIGCSTGDVGAGGRPTIALARRLTDAAGRFRGVIVADLDPGYFSRFFADLDLGREAVVTLTENHGHLLLASTGSGMRDAQAVTATLVSPTERRRLREAEQASRGQITATHATEGYPLSVLVGISRGEVLRRWWQVVAPTFGLAVAAGALLFALAINLERQRAERARASQRAAVTETLEAMGQMTASVAHDFRNVLTALGGSLRIIGKRGPESVVLAEAAAMLARGNAMVDRLLAFSRRQDLRLETHDVNALVTDLETTLRHVAGPGVAVTLQLAPVLPLCRLDRVQFDAALMNLVVNAKQAMPTGGSVVVASHVLDGASPGAEVTVRDTGSGIDPATLKRVFEPFFTTKAHTGTGLGLAQVKSFAAEIGGCVAIASTVGVGTTVSLHLPAASGVATMAAKAPELVGSGGI